MKDTNRKTLIYQGGETIQRKDTVCQKTLDRSPKLVESPQGRPAAYIMLAYQTKTLIVMFQQEYLVSEFIRSLVWLNLCGHVWINGCFYGHWPGRAGHNAARASDQCDRQL